MHHGHLEDEPTHAKKNGNEIGQPFRRAQLTTPSRLLPLLKRPAPGAGSLLQGKYRAAIFTVRTVDGTSDHIPTVHRISFSKKMVFLKTQ
jgi:hypothetical protein